MIAVRARLIITAICFTSIFQTPPASADAPPIGICETVQKTFNSTASLPIPDFNVANPNAVVSSQIVVSGVNFLNQPGFIWDVDVRTHLRHTFNADIEMTLQSPEGTVVTLTTDNGGQFDNVFNGTVWDDTAAPGGSLPYTTSNGLVTDHPYVNLTLASPLVPEEGLLAFKNENPNGVWTLTIRDDVSDDVGTLDDWQLMITAIPKPVGFGGSGFATAANLSIPDQTTVTSKRIQPAGIVCHMSVQFDINHPRPSDLDVALTAPNGRSVTLTTDNAESFANSFTGTRFTSINDLGSQIPYSDSNIVSDHDYASNTKVELLTPEESLAQFYGRDQEGEWTLTVSDDTPNNVGTLNSWEMSVSLCPTDTGDSDSDGFKNGCDGCPDDATKIDKGACGCGTADTDSDSDGTADCSDLCPADPSKISAGLCGCGTADLDTDSDGKFDCQETCTSDPTKTAPGQCGCGTVDTDTDSDGKADCIDSCSADPAKTEVGKCGCGVGDIDGNGNGAFDCQINSELIARSQNAIRLLKRLNTSLSGKKRKEAKAQTSAAIKSLRDYVASGLIFSLATNKVNLTKLSTTIKKSSKTALKLDSSTFAVDKRAALKALAAISRSVKAEP